MTTTANQNHQFRIKNHTGTALGTLVFAKERIIFSEDSHAALREAVHQIISGGLKRYEHIGDNEKSFFVVKDVILGDIEFPSALKRALEAMGYEVLLYDADVVQNIKRLLAEFPASETTTDILRELPEMSYLEHTAMLETLENFTSQRDKIGEESHQEEYKKINL